MHDRIKTICEQTHPSLIYHRSTINYIISLIHPYLESFDNSKNFAKWIDEYIPDEFISNIQSDMKNKAKFCITRKETREIIADNILTSLIDLSGICAVIKRDTYVLPWDVQSIMVIDSGLSEIFKLNKFDVQLPVSIRNSYSTL